MNWFKKLIPSRIRTTAQAKKGVPDGLWFKCNQCQAILYRLELERHLLVCPKCGYHMRLSARKRLAYFLDEQDRVEIANHVQAIDFLKFKDLKKYKDRLLIAQKSTGEKEALLVIQGKLQNMPLIVAAFEFDFIGGSMGSAVGERFTQAVHAAIALHVPLVCFTASGGARMQEGLISLMQMAKVSAALAKLSEKRIPYIVILTDPTMGGVSASLATLGDIIIAEPKALIGFAGPRVIEQTVREKLPEGFQHSEFLLCHGAIDMILSRHALRETVYRLLSNLMHTVE